SGSCRKRFLYSLATLSPVSGKKSGIAEDGAETTIIALVILWSGSSMTSVTPLTQSSDGYSTAWQGYRLNRRWTLGLFASFPFAMSTVIVLTDDSARSATILVVVFLTYGLLISVLGLRWTYWPCPRCGRAFRGRGITFPVQCRNCGLPRPQNISF